MKIKNYSNFSSTATPVAIQNNDEKSEQWISVGVGVTHTVLLNESGLLWCWGLG